MSDELGIHSKAQKGNTGTVSRHRRLLSMWHQGLGHPNICFDKKYPWLLLYGFDDNAPDKCYMYDFIKPSLCTFYFPHLSNIVVLESKAGWLLARRCGDDDDQFFLYSLSTLEKMDLPKHKTYSEQVGSFVVPLTTTTPRDYLAFIVSRTGDSSLEISLCRGAGNDLDLKWDVQRICVGNDGRFGTTRAVDCSDADGRCNCKMREEKERIYINGSKDGLAYDFVNKKVVCWAANSFRSGGHLHLCMCSECYF